MPAGPIITLTSDFGLTDFYVSAMKSVLLQFCPNATLIDITHQIPRHDLRSASFTLERAVNSFAKGSIHLAVVDPGVGSERRLLVVNIKDSTVICPDNGLVTWAWNNHPGSAAYEISWRSERFSSTFHGRDILSPVAGMIAAGRVFGEFVGGQVAPVLLKMPLAKGPVGEIIHIDHFGNATTNIPAATLNAFSAGAMVKVRERPIPFKQTYTDVEPGQPLALIGSSELLEIAVRIGSAAEVLKIEIGDPVRVSEVA